MHGKERSDLKGKKKILLAVVLVLVMAVGITSIVVIRKRNKIVVKVFPVSSLNSSDWNAYFRFYTGSSCFRWTKSKEDLCQKR
jgi:hypothetical protein